MKWMFLPFQFISIFNVLQTFFKETRKYKVLPLEYTEVGASSLSKDQSLYICKNNS